MRLAFPETELWEREYHRLRLLFFPEIKLREKLRNTESHRQRRASNPEKHTTYHRNYRRGNKSYRKYRREYTARRRKSEIHFKIAETLRSRLSCSIRSIPKTNKTLELLGCSIASFKLYLESKFEPGMSWGNYGKWHIDHIMPISIFDLTKVKHRMACFHFSNMQPLWARENISKGNKILMKEVR